MFLSINWLKNTLNIGKIDLKSLNEKLTLSGFEIENINIKNILGRKDKTLDLTTTANRPDVLSVLGICFEIKSLLGIEWKINQDFAKDNFYINSLKLNQSKAEDFPYIDKYLIGVITNVKLKSSPYWMQRRLLGCGIQPKNNLYDIPHYTMLEWGQPFQIYDFDKIKKITNNINPEITIRPAKNQEIFVVEKSIMYTLSETNFLVTADGIPISILGLITREDVHVDNRTKNILLESLIFNTRIFRQSTKKIRIRTYASVFYEKGINFLFFETAYSRIIDLFSVITSTSSFVESKIYFYKTLQKSKSIFLNYQKINQVLGTSHTFDNLNKTNITKFDVHSYLHQLGFKYYESFYRNNVVQIFVPQNRYIDIDEEIDIIEEIGRFHGFNNFVSQIPKMLRVGKLSKIETLKKKLRQCFLNSGFSEIFLYSFSEFDQNNSPKVINPLTLDYKNLKTTLIPGLIDILLLNLNQGNTVIQAFEINRIFKKTKKKEKKILEEEYLAGLFGADFYRLGWETNFSHTNWFEAKGFLEKTFSAMNFYFSFHKNSTPSSLFHPGRTCEIFLKKESIGQFGQIHPKLANEKGISLRVFLFELNLTKLLKISRNKLIYKYKSYSVYPFLNIDVSLLVPKSVSFKEIKTVVLNNKNKFFLSIRIFDIYKGFDNSEKFYSLGITLSFKDYNKTLKKSDIKSNIKNITSQLENKLNIKIKT